MIVTVLDPEKGVCADPVERDATLGVGGLGPPVGVSERKLSLDREAGRRDMTRWEGTKKTTPSRLQEAIMHKVSVNVHKPTRNVHSM
jgi:hypothetical protein